jgi:hypothetical protein
MTRALLRKHVQDRLPMIDDFPTLVDHCLGAWPGDVAEVLDELSALRGASADRALWLLENARRPTQCPVQSDPDLPLEHPLDSDWRFEASERGRLLDQVTGSLAPNEKILAICVPTIVLEAGKRGIGSRIVVGTRPNDPMIEALQKHVPDASYISLDALEGVEAGAGIIDPPWQDCVAKPLIQRLLSGVCVGARVLVSGPDLLTAATSVAALRSSDGSPCWVGFRVDRQPLRVRYGMPRFEARALQASGVANVSLHWRTGLVHSYRKTAIAHQNLDLAPPSDWIEVPLGEHRVWVRPQLSSLQMKIAVSKSVSSAEPSRQVASVWTSGNTVVVGGSAMGLESLAQHGRGTLHADFAECLLNWEERFCWKTLRPAGERLAAHGGRCENLRPAAVAGLP